LDPGEPGLLRSARASESFLRVSAQERRNLHRLESEARLKGRKVIYSRIKYRFGLDGSFPTIRAGETTVVSVKSSENEQKKIVLPEEDNKDERNRPENPGDVVARKDEDDIEDELKMLQIEKERLENKIKKIEDDEQNLMVPQNRTMVFREFEEVKRKIDELKFEKMKLELNNQQNNVNEMVINNSNFPERFSLYNNRNRSMPGSFIDIKG